MHMKYVEGLKNITVTVLVLMCPSLILLPSFPFKRTPFRISYFAFLHSFIMSV